MGLPTQETNFYTDTIFSFSVEGYISSMNMKETLKVDYTVKGIFYFALLYFVSPKLQEKLIRFPFCLPCT